MSSSATETKKGFGTFKGIFVPNITMMFGVIIFLRLGLVVGNVGLLQFILILALSLGIMILTSLSIAMVVSNMNVGGGGVYYLISRSLGIEIGGAIGIALVLAQVISLVLCVSGFGYSLVSLFPHLDVRTVQIATLLILATFSYISVNIALKAQILIFILLMISIGSIFFGFIKPTGIASSPYFETPLGFWKAFALFYPALTGIEAGMALSGSLRNPRKSLSIGNIISLVFAALTYLGIAVFLWLSFSEKSLASSPFLLLKYSKIPSLIYMGIWSATLSSALGNLLGAPRILQVIAEDNIAPEIFGRTYGKYDEPRFALGLILLISLIVLVTTTIDQILPILTMICLLTYGTINLVAGLAELIRAPSWRPSFQIHWKYAILGALGCFFLMLMIDPAWTLVSIILIGGLYFILRNRSIDVSFEDIRESILLFFSRIALYRLSNRTEGPKNWLPQILVLSKSTIQHERMVLLAYELTGRSGILTISTLLPEEWNEPEQLNRTHQVIKDWLSERGIAGFSEIHTYAEFQESVQNLIKMHGLGPLQPNTIMIPISEEDTPVELTEIAQTAAIYQKNLLLFFDASQSGADFSLPSKRKVIDLWWDPEHRESFELMLSLVLLLRTNPIWNFRELNLRTHVADESAKSHLKTYFQSYLKKIRLRCKTSISIGNEPLAHAVTKYSHKADLVLFPLRPFDKGEDEKQYEYYLEDVVKSFRETDIPVLAVCSNDALDHKEVYLPESAKLPQT